MKGRRILTGVAIALVFASGVVALLPFDLSSPDITIGKKMYVVMDTSCRAPAIDAWNAKSFDGVVLPAKLPLGLHTIIGTPTDATRISPPCESHAQRRLAVADLLLGMALVLGLLAVRPGRNRAPEPAVVT